MILDSEVAYLRKREAEEIAAAARTHCMARTAHEDLAESYAEQAEAREKDLTTDAGYRDLLERLDQLT